MRWLVATCAWLAGSTVIYLSNLSFFVAGGSDSLTDIAAPPLIGQVLAMMLAGAGLANAAWPRAAGGMKARTASFVLSLILILVASHRVVVDNGQGRIRDLWLLSDLQVMPFDQRDGPASSASLERGVVWDRIVPGSGAPAVIVIKGVPPLALDMAPVEIWWTRR